MLSTSIKVKVRFCEVDSCRMVWHGNYVKYLEDAREEFGRKFGLDYKHIFESGYYAPVYDMHLRYERSAFIDDDLIVTITWQPALGAKLCFEYQVHRAKDNALILTASTIQLFVTTEGEFEPTVPEFYKQWKKEMESF